MTPLNKVVLLLGKMVIFLLDLSGEQCVFYNMKEVRVVHFTHVRGDQWSTSRCIRQSQRDLVCEDARPMQQSFAEQRNPLRTTSLSHSPATVN